MTNVEVRSQNPWSLVLRFVEVAHDRLPDVPAQVVQVVRLCEDGRSGRPCRQAAIRLFLDDEHEFCDASGSRFLPDYTLNKEGTGQMKPIVAPP